MVNVRGRTLRLVTAGLMTAAGLLAGGGHRAGASEVASPSDWLGEVNYYRAAAGLPAVSDNPALDQGIADHLIYMAKTPAALMTGQYASLHTENPASPYYTASGAQEAASSDLYDTGTKMTPVAFIDGWLEAPFHAIGMLRPALTSVAFDTDPTFGGAGLDVISGLNPSAPPATSPVLFPGPNSSTDLYAYGGENPDPLETCGWQSSAAQVGLGLVMLLPSAPSSSLTASLAGPGGAESSGAGTLCVVDQYTYHSSDQVYGPTGLDILKSDHAVLLFPRAPLQDGRYTVTVGQAGQPDITWSFTDTRPVPPTCDRTLPSGSVVGMAETPDGSGYWIAGSGGAVAACGDAPALGDVAGRADSPIVAVTAAPSGTGFWLVSARGSVYSFGSAGYAGGVPAGVHLNAPVVAMAADPATGGYWLLGGDGGVFSFNAPFLGSTGGIHLDRPAVGMEATPDGQGYRFVASDGGIFDYGDAQFFGSTGGVHLNQPVVGMADDPATGGYWLDAADGGVFSFNAPFYGSTGNVHLDQPCVGLTATPDGGGYRFVAADGGIFDFGDAGFFGSAA